MAHVSRTMVEGVSKQGTEKDIWTSDGRIKKRLEKTA